jgi:hypothetical protein
VDGLLSKLSSYFGETFSPSSPINNSVYISNCQSYDSLQCDATLPYSTLNRSDSCQGNDSSSSYRDLCSRIHKRLSGSFSTLVSAAEPGVVEHLPPTVHDGVGESTIMKLFGISWLGRRGQQSETDLLMTTGEMSDRFRKAIIIAVNFSIFCCKCAL